MQQMSFIHTLHFYATQIINPFLNLRVSVNHDKVNGISANVGQTINMYLKKESTHINVLIGPGNPVKL